MFCYICEEDKCDAVPLQECFDSYDEGAPVICEDCYLQLQKEGKIS